MTYERKIDFAIKLFRSIPQDGPLEISYSGGKDSDVILRLAQMSGVKHEAIYKQTSIDPPGTTAHAKEMGYKKIITYITEQETGVSLRASGYEIEATGCGGNKGWDMPSRPRIVREETLFGELCATYPIGYKKRYYKNL